MPKNDGVIEAWRANEKLYLKGEEVRHDGHRFVCRENHYAGYITEPKKGIRWFEYWDLVEDIELPKVDVSTKLFFAPGSFTSMEQIDFDRLSELVESGECEVRFELKYPECKPIRISRMELVDIEETPLGTVAHFLVLRDLTDEEE